MWLINVHTMKLEEVWGETVKVYAILSHRWEEEEISFTDMQNPDESSHKKGYTKIMRACQQAASHNIDYIWADTCCIDKRSSAELSEAINSMWRWYKAARVCYTYLADVDHALIEPIDDQIRSSTWFTRGWTLQELIAPRHLVFFDQSWKKLGTKRTMSELMTSRTGVDEAILNGTEDLSRRSVAQRMSWASRRVTTRVEDMAYCLLGIFKVNMPMLYGEGDRAFLRLQEEIIKHTDDHTIFAWPIHRRVQPGLLADSPAAFVACQNIRTLRSRKGRSAFSLTNRGLSVQLKAIRYCLDTYLCALDCTDQPISKDDRPEKVLGMFLKRLDEDDQFARVTQEGRTFVVWRSITWQRDTERRLGLIEMYPVNVVEFNVRQNVTASYLSRQKGCVNGFRLAASSWMDVDRVQIKAAHWNVQNAIMSFDPPTEGAPSGLTFKTSGPVGIVNVAAVPHSKIRAIELGFDFNWNPVCFIAMAEPQHSIREDCISSGLATKLTDYDNENYSLKKYWRLPYVDVVWSKYSVDGGTLEVQGTPHVWALKGDRINGLKARLQVRDNSLMEIANLSIERVPFRHEDVWEVRLEPRYPADWLFWGGHGREEQQ